MNRKGAVVVSEDPPRNEHLLKVENLLLPVNHKYGAKLKVEKLIEELRHPNIDWKYVISGLREYLYDYLYDVLPYSEHVLPIVFHYIFVGTQRGKASAIRAADTFFDRYIFILKNLFGKDYYDVTERLFSDFAVNYCHLLIQLSRENLFFGYVNDIVRIVGFLLGEKGDARNIRKLLAEFLYLQYCLYVENAITLSSEKIAHATLILADTSNADLIEHLHSVSREFYLRRIALLHATVLKDCNELFSEENPLLDFTHNRRKWEEISRQIADAVSADTLKSDKVVKSLIAFLISTTTKGKDCDLQLFISKIVASLCEHFVKTGKTDLVRNVISLVMPTLLKEIENGGNYQAAFATIYNIGSTIIKNSDALLIDYFIDFLVRAKFCFPEYSGIAQDWSVIVNSSHLENIRTWLRLIELNPPMMKKLAAALIVNLKLGGVFLKDTDVFQRDISRLLNSDYRDVFYLIISLAAVFPTFYRDIGATGTIRAITEKIDMYHSMDDPIHFLRKQIHVESSSRTVLLMQMMFEFWLTGNLSLLKGLVPTEVYETLPIFLEIDRLKDNPHARELVEEVKKNVGVGENVDFWNFLLTVEPDRFVREAEIIAQQRGDNFTHALSRIVEYFKRRSPAEMGKMLRTVVNKAKNRFSGLAVWDILYSLTDEEIIEICNAQDDAVSCVNREKFLDFIHVYRLVYDKYNFSEIRAFDRLKSYAQDGIFSPPPFFFDALSLNDEIAALDALLLMQEELKEEVLLSPKTFEPLDTIEFKRHIAFGIPSMYGSYKEKKFDTLQVFFHMNIIRARLFEKLLEKFRQAHMKALDFVKIKKLIKLFFKAFTIDGLANQEMSMVVNLLETPQLKISQLRDIIHTLLVIHGEISDRFNEMFAFVIRESIKNIGVEKISKNFAAENSRTFDVEVIVDRFMRGQIMQSPLLQLFDNLLVFVKEKLAEYERDEVCLNSFSGRKRSGVTVRLIQSEPPSNAYEVCAPIWEVGGKAHGLMFVSRRLGMNVPEGFVISSDFYKRVKEDNIKNPRFRRKLLHFIKKYVDEFTKGRFANPANPILLSARSGAVFSMPGVMDTITNIGITEEILDRLSRVDAWFAYDCYRRLIQDFGISLYGIDRSVFENLMAIAKSEAGVDLKEKLTGTQMKLLTRKYRYVINDYGYSIPKDPYEQLLYAILAVFQSWESPIARNYRKFINVSDEWGTAVIVQRMVFGNIKPSSITGVVHSQYVGREKLSLFGEYKTRAQGHDIVSGVARVFPISEEQKKLHAKSAEYPSLETSFPHHYRRLAEAVKRIRDSWGNDVEIEFTCEDDELYILQVRGMTKHVFEYDIIDEEPEKLQKDYLGQGLAASGGAVSGRIVFHIDRIDEIRKQYPSDRIILVRPETNPEDVIGLMKSDGILTCVGGMTSHAVLQMRRLEKSGVSDFSVMRIDEKKNQAIVECRAGENGRRVFKEGDFITIDGTTGNVFAGYHRTRPIQRASM
ncbi:MAG: PEP-utilizing enzyme [Spirochaetes bacterium]|nr:PEP-utilizing enzyme [Spirochaetota bacterium]